MQTDDVSADMRRFLSMHAVQPSPQCRAIWHASAWLFMQAGSPRPVVVRSAGHDLACAPRLATQRRNPVAASSTLTRCAGSALGCL